MLTFAYYILKVIICSGILYAYYLWALKDKIFHSWNRFYLLAAVTLSLAAPLIKINIWQKPQEPATQVIHLIQSFNTNDEVMYEYTRHQQSFHIDASNASLFIYIIISALLLALLIKTLLRINYIKRSNNCTVVEGINFINTDAKGTPFSFFNNIFWNNKIDLNTLSGKQIFKHEVAHVREKHSYDKIFLNIVLILFWCNPIFWLIKKELNLIHEFIADKKAIEDNDTASFAAMVLNVTYPQQQFSITNNFFYSPLKRRLTMLTKNKNPKINYLSRLLVLPLVALVFFAFTLKAKVNNNIYKGKRITVMIDAGHGGYDKGASVNNINEKDITLSLAKKIKEINTNDNINIVLTRDADSSFNLTDRIDMIKTFNADLFISIHVDAEVNKNEHSGFSVFIPGTNNVYFKESNTLGSDMIESFKTNYPFPVDNELKLREKGVKILNSNNCPAILIETGFLTTQKDLAYLIKPINQRQIAQNILNAIENYAQQSVNAADLHKLSAQSNRKIINDSIPKYYHGKKIKEAHGSNKLHKALILYEDGTKDTISIQDAEKIRLIPAPPPLVPYNSSVNDIQDKNAVTIKATAVATKQDNQTDLSQSKLATQSSNDLIMKNISIRGDKPGYMAIKADKVIIKDKEQKPSFMDNNLLIMNGKIINRESLINKLITAKEVRVYPTNSDEAIKLFGDAAKNGVTVFIDATITDNIKKETTDTIPDRVFTKVELEASFPGGAEAWRKYITKVMQDNIKELATEGISGTCQLRFIVNTDGTVTNVTALTLKETKLAQVAINAIKKGPKWNPAKQNGYIIAAYREQPITFNISEN